MCKIDWSKLPEKANYVAKDNIGRWHWYETKPEYSETFRQWLLSESKYYGEIDPSLVYIYSQVEPKESLISKEQTMTQNNPKPHRHSELIKKWVDDTSLQFEFYHTEEQKWIDCESNPYWLEDLEYRLKPKDPEYITINGMKVPKPETEKPKVGQLYYVPFFGREDCLNLLWSNCEWENEYLQNGMVHLNPEAAILHKKAIVKANTGD